MVSLFCPLTRAGWLETSGQYEVDRRNTGYLCESRAELERREEDREETEIGDSQYPCTAQSLSININKVSGDFKDIKLTLNHHVLFDLRMTIAYVFFVTLLSITYCSNTGLIPSLN